MRTTTLLLSLCLALGAIAGCGPNRTHPMRLPWDGDAAVPPLDCVPNLDGRIDAMELEPSIGTPVSFLVAPAGEERDVDLVGTPIDDGDTRWDLGADYGSDRVATRSEEHTSELQSRRDLVCRLLLE